MVNNQENGLSAGEKVLPTNGTAGKKLESSTVQAAETKLTEYMLTSLRKVALSEGFKYYGFKVDQGSGVGDGFVGLLYKVTIQEIQGNKKLTVVVKFPPESKARRDDFGAMGLFKREVFMYNELLPEFVKLQRENNIEDSEGFFNFPKCYLAEFNDEDSIIIMEDLRESDYKMWNKREPINLEHTKLAVEALGKLHALSFALKEQNPELFDKFTGLSDFIAAKFSEEKMSMMMSASMQKAVDCLDESDVKRRSRASKLKENFGQMMRELTDPERAEPYAVVNHGDCWSNNFMFNYKVS